MRTSRFAILAASALLSFVAGCGEPISAIDPDGASDSALADPIDSTIPVDATPEWGAGITVTEVFLDAAGLSVAYGGTGLVHQPATFSVDIPVMKDSDVQIAAFYWVVRTSGTIGDNTIFINGVERRGRVMASFPTNNAEGVAIIYKLGGQNRGFVTAGLNTFEVSGLDVEHPGRTDGIGMLATYRDPGGFRRIEIQNVPEYFHGPQEVEGGVHTFTFPAAGAATTAQLTLLAGDCVDEHADALWWSFGQGAVPTRLVGGPYDSRRDVLGSRQGSQFDVIHAPSLPVPAGADHFVFQIQSPRVPRGDSGILAVAALCVDPIGS